MEKQGQAESGASRLRLARKSRGIKSGMMAKILRRARKSYCALEKRGVKTMRLATIIGNILDVPPTDILEPKTKKEVSPSETVSVEPEGLDGNGVASNPALQPNAGEQP